ncbi:MAG: hypothetical protein M1837_000276 [Sclerophora amabilis]|nr:MAG: hypothetical protein M1837_000276 [Sclerophora amabilis]
MATADEEIGNESAGRLIRKREDARTFHEHDPAGSENSSVLGESRKWEELATTVDTLKSDIKELRATVNERETHIDGIRAELGNFRTVTLSYMSVRSRFFDTFLKDKNSWQKRAADGETFSKDNDFAHRGDALIDALMYEENVRSDRSTFRDLYGSNPDQVLSLRDDATTVNALNAHATVKSNSKQTAPPLCFYRAFSLFTDEIEAAGLKSNHLLNPSAPVSKAYNTYWEEYKRLME